nr:PEP-CTERM sorting domain-containing protein [uncultured Duganella sp.]
MTDRKNLACKHTLTLLLATLAWLPRADAALILDGDTYVNDDGTYRTLAVGANDGLTGTALLTGFESFSHVAVGAGLYGQGIGSMTVSGPGTSLVASNFVGVGTTGNGTLTISNGASVESLGGKSPYCDVRCNYTIIANGGGSTGVVNVVGVGSSFKTTDSLNDNAGFFIGNGAISGTFGRPNARTHGELNVLDGATATTKFAYLGVLAGANALTGASGYARVDGAGSTWTVTPTINVDAFVQVGQGGAGVVEVLNGGTVNALQMTLGALPTGDGSVNINGLGSTLNLAGAGVEGNGGARLTVGQRGVGRLYVSNGGLLNIDSGNTLGGILLGSGNGGRGDMLVSGGGQVRLSGQESSTWVANATLKITGGSSFSAAYGSGSAGQMLVGSHNANLRSVVEVSGHSVLNAGSLLGVGSFGDADTRGAALVLVKDESVITATNIVVGTRGVFGGHGTINGNVVNNGGLVQVGASPDALIINGNYLQQGGEMHFEIDPDGHGGFLTSTLVFVAGKTIGINKAKIFFDFAGGANAVDFLASGAFGLNTFFKTVDGETFSDAFVLSQLFGGNEFVMAGYAVSGFDPLTGTLNAVAAVPEASTWLMLAAGLLMVAFYWRRNAGKAIGFTPAGNAV